MKESLRNHDSLVLPAGEMHPSWYNVDCSTSLQNPEMNRPSIQPPEVVINQLERAEEIARKWGEFAKKISGPSASICNFNGVKCFIERKGRYFAVSLGEFPNEIKVCFHQTVRFEATKQALVDCKEILDMAEKTLGEQQERATNGAQMEFDLTVLR